MIRIRTVDMIERSMPRTVNNKVFFFFNDPPTPKFSPLPQPDALPISLAPVLEPIPKPQRRQAVVPVVALDGLEKTADFARAVTQCHRRFVRLEGDVRLAKRHGAGEDRKSTRLNSSHSQISYAVFCLKK